MMIEEHNTAAAKSGGSRAAEERSSFALRDSLHRVIASPTFLKAERLSALLKYICDVTLQGRAAELNEQHIGHAVFGRKRDYDSSIDGIVRTQASRLRQRLDLYYRNEGHTETLRIVIPRGSYVPRFVEEAPAELPIVIPPFEASPVRPPAALPEIPASSRRPSLATILLGALCLILAGALALLVLRERSGQGRAADGFAASAHPLWREMFLPERTTLYVPGDSGLVLYHAFRGQSVSLNEYLVGSYRHPDSTDSTSPTKMGSDLSSEFANRRYTSIVDLESAVAFHRIAEAARSSLDIRYARDLRPNDLKCGNVLLFGAAEANPWVELFENNMNFSLHNNYQTHVFTVANRSPIPGEPKSWEAVANDPEHRVFGIVAYRPNLSGNGRALIIEGTSMAGAEAALDFLLDDTRMMPMLKRIQREGSPLPFFELLVTTQNTSASAVHSSLIAFRVSDEPHVPIPKP